jgi:two-component system, sporulation sensor kinase B
MIFTAIVSWIIKTTGFITYIALSGHFDAHAFLVSELFFIWHCIVILMFVFLLEYIKKNALLVEEVMKTEKMRIVSDIAAAVAHEVRNPLTAVRGFLQLLQQEDLSSESRKKYATISLDELHRAQNIISDYLSLAKPEAEEVEHINVNEEIEYVVKVLSSYANINDVVVESNISNTIELTGNRARFKQCLINICKNAIEAMPQGGLLTIQAEIHNNQASITISDTGDGMKKHQVERLGMPYYSTKEEGTGLGTMVAFSIVRQMGGKISAISEEGKGTSFILRFPFEKSGSGELR